MARNVIAEKTSASLLLSEILICGAALALGVAKSVADAAYGEQILGVFRILLDLLAQVPDVDVNRARVPVGGIAPDPRQQHVASEHPPRRPGQRRQDLEL